MDDLKERQKRLEGELAVEEAKESLKLNRDRVLYWLTQMARASHEQIIELFVSRVIITEDGARHVILMIDDENPPDGLPSDGEGFVQSQASPTRLESGEPHMFAFHIIRRGFVLVWR